MGNASLLASRMKYYSPEDYISGSWLIKEYAPDWTFTDILDCMTPEKSNVVVQGKFASAKTDRRERWYGTPYHVSSVPESILNRWRDPERNDRLRFPNRIQFIPTVFNILDEQLPPEEDEGDSEGPRCIMYDMYMDLHYKLDRTFRTPKVSMFMQMKTPLASLSRWHRVMFDMFTERLVNSLSELFCSTNRVGFQCDLFASFSHLVDVLFLNVVDRLATFEPDICHFQETLEATMRKLQG